MPRQPAFGHKIRLANNPPAVSSFINSAIDVPVATHEYYPSWGNVVSARTLVAGNIGACRISPIELDPTRTYDRLRARVNNASSSTHRLGIYYLSRTTWLPTALALDAGTVVWAGVGGDRTVTISFTPAQTLCGLGMLYESRLDAVNPAVPTLTAPSGGAWPPGYNAGSATLNDVDNYAIESTGNAAGAMPAASTFVHAVEATITNVQFLIGIRVT